jgi:hypothetical protein
MPITIDLKKARRNRRRRYKRLRERMEKHHKTVASECLKRIRQLGEGCFGAWGKGDPEVLAREAIDRFCLKYYPLRINEAALRFKASNVARSHCSSVAQKLRRAEEKLGLQPIKVSVESAKHFFPSNASELHDDTVASIFGGLQVARNTVLTRKERKTIVTLLAPAIAYATPQRLEFIDVVRNMNGFTKANVAFLKNRCSQLPRIWRRAARAQASSEAWATLHQWMRKSGVDLKLRPE